MDVANSSAKAAGLAGPSNEDLIRRYCAEPPDKEASEELWRRSIPELLKTIKKMVYAKSSICPDWYSRDAFVEDAASIANEKIFRGIHTFKFECAFEGWLARIAKNAVFDVRRREVGRGKNPRPRPESIDAVAGKEPAVSDPGFRSKYWIDPFSLVRDREIREIVLRLLALHLEQSPDDRESPDAIVLYSLEEEPVKDIAETFGCSERTVWRLFEHDYPELQELAIAKFGIAKFGDL